MIHPDLELFKKILSGEITIQSAQDIQVYDPRPQQFQSRIAGSSMPTSTSGENVQRLLGPAGQHSFTLSLRQSVLPRLLEVNTKNERHNP